RASEEEHPDLFWGIRGAGANFGIVTSFEFRLHPLDPVVTQGVALYPVDRARETAARYADFAASAPEVVMPALQFVVVPPGAPWPDLVGRPVVSVGATHTGRLEDAERDLRPLLAERPLANTFGQKTYLSLQGSADEAMAWGKRFYMKG